MVSKILKEFRCKNCNKLFFKGNIQHATIEVKCRNCKTINMIKGANCQLWLFLDEGKEKKEQSKTIEIDNLLLKCEQCEQAASCGYYKNQKLNKE